jgi:hypothetical protein
VTTTITLIFDNPRDPAKFEQDYPHQLTLAKKIPGIQRVETSKVWPKEDGSPTPAYRLVNLYFADYDAAGRAVAPMRQRRSSLVSLNSAQAVSASRSRMSRNADLRRGRPPRTVAP